jgi:hypothetical protein
MLWMVAVCERVADWAVSQSPLLLSSLGRTRDCPMTMDGATTVTDALPLRPPLVAATEKGPPGAVPAVNKPVDETVPPPFADQENVGSGESATPN